MDLKKEKAGLAHVADCKVEPHVILIWGDVEQNGEFVHLWLWWVKV